MAVTGIILRKKSTEELSSDDDEMAKTTSRERILILKSLKLFLLPTSALLTLLLCILAQLTNTFFLNVETIVKQSFEHLPQNVTHHATLNTYTLLSRNATIAMLVIVIVEIQLDTSVSYCFSQTIYDAESDIRI